jgi:hypothetical protein
VFLRFIEQNDLKPGESIEVEERDAASDSVQVRGKNDRRITIGTRAASKLLVNVARVLVLVLLSGSAFAQDRSGHSSSRPWEITDNSFLVEEAFNQEPGIVQNIFGIYAPGDGSWVSAFTQEWPVRVQAHQFSYTVAFADVGVQSGLADTQLHYRYQLWTEAAGRPAFSPRISLVLPTGRASDGLGVGTAGWEINLPFSKQVRDFYFHWNGGVTHLPSVEDGSATFNVVIPRVAASAIWRAKPMFNLMLESVFTWPEEIEDASTERVRFTTVVPGFRTGWNIGEAQAIAGLGVPVTFGRGTADTGVFGYFSYELPFMRTR